MSWNLIRQELSLNRRSWWIGAFVILLFQGIYGGSAKTYMDNGLLLEKMNSLPAALLDAFGIHLNMLNSFEGWMSGQPYAFLVLLLGAYAAIWSSAGIAKERDQKTGEFLFSLPYGRWTVFLSKAAAHWLQVTIITVLNIALTLLLGAAFNDMKEPSVIILLAVAGYMVVLAFAGIGYVVTVFLSSERAALSVGIGVVLVSFLLNMVSGMSENLKGLSHLSLFNAFATDRIVTDHNLTVMGIIITLGLYVCGIGLGGSLFRRQDI